MHELPVIPSRTLLYEPAGQTAGGAVELVAKQYDAPAIDVVSALQGRQYEDPAALYEPLAHTEHTLSPGFELLPG